MILCLPWLCMHSPHSYWPLRAQTCVCKKNFIMLLLVRQHINHNKVGLPPPAYTHHRYHTVTVLVGESFASKAVLALIERKKKSWVSSLCLWGQSGAKKQIAADNLIIHCWAWALHYLTEIDLSQEASGFIEQERWGR